MKYILVFILEIILATLTLYAGYIYCLNYGDNFFVGVIIAIIYCFFANLICVFGGVK